MLKSTLKPLGELENPGEFAARHIGPDAADEQRMLDAIGVPTRAALIDAIVPPSIRRPRPMQLPAAVGEAQRGLDAAHGLGGVSGGYGEIATEQQSLGEALGEIRHQLRVTQGRNASEPGWLRVHRPTGPDHLGGGRNQFIREMAVGFPLKNQLTPDRFAPAGKNAACLSTQ